jgi:phage shock protein PspC (stress-responsive transcriptional regulator)
VNQYPRRLYRSTDDSVIAGVAGGLAAYMDVDSALVRLIWVLSIFVTGSLTFWIYLVMMIVVPPEPSDWPAQSGWAPGGAPLSGQAGAPGAAPGSAPGSAPASDPNATMPGAPPAPAPGGWWAGDWRSQRRQDRWERRQEKWQARWQARSDRAEYHSYGGPGLTFGLMLVLIGGLLAWHQFDSNFDLNAAWPIAIIAFGAILVSSSFRFRNG